MKGIDKSFSGVRVLTSASLDVEAGEVMALVGQNGAGKSTLIKILTGAYPPRCRQHRLPGQPTLISDRRPPSQAAGIATIYQEINLAPHRSVAENIFLGREPRTVRPRRPPPHAHRSARRAEALQSRHRCRPPARGFRRRDTPDGGDRPRRHPECAAGHHGRADLLARRARSGGAVRHHPHAERPTASRRSSSAIGSTSSTRSATASPSCATAARSP